MHTIVQLPCVCLINLVEATSGKAEICHNTAMDSVYCDCALLEALQWESSFGSLSNVSASHASDYGFKTPLARLPIAVTLELLHTVHKIGCTPAWGCEHNALSAYNACGQITS